MKVLVELKDKNISEYKNIDGIILGLEDYSVFNSVTYTKEEIKDITNKYSDLDIFIKIDKNIFNSEINELKEILTYLSKLNITGIFFYDLALLQIKKDLNLDINLVWSQTHMVTNYRTCNYYNEKGVEYALLSKEITLDEIIEISTKSTIKTIVEVFSKPTVGFSRRKLVTNYNHDIGVSGSKELEVLEKVSNDTYLVKEEDAGTGFILNKILNGTSVIKTLYENNVDYILLREVEGIDFKEFVNDTKDYIDNNCLDDNYISKYKKLGDSTGFFFKKTIYRVKK
ncbi:MAG: hypothetical protein E7160_01435 [Firmicutes bacterium]|nr:hypothetical protein [Bacillota bacterium]